MTNSQEDTILQAVCVVDQSLGLAWLLISVLFVCIAVFQVSNDLNCMLYLI